MIATGIILAAGKGTRMVSELPKALHPVCGIPMTEHCVRAMRGAGVQRPIVVIGHAADAVRQALGGANDYVLQEQQLGTGHALRQTVPVLEKAAASCVIVMPGDAPLICGETLTSLLQTHQNENAQITLAVCQFDDPTGYGRVIRKNGSPAAIVEERDCSPEQRQIKEVCVSLYCFDIALLRHLLPKLSNDNAQHEYYLTDIIALGSEAGCKIAAWEAPDPSELAGVNDRWQLAQAEKHLRKRRLMALAMSGVSIVDPKSCYIDMDVEVAPDARIEPNCYLHGKTSIGSGSVIGPETRLVDTLVGKGCTVLSSNCREATIGDRTRVGPFAHLRPGAVIGEDCSIGDYVEIKKAVLGNNVSVAHLTYLGDAEVGDGANIGAGTITCNYDGKSKHKTVIGRGAFIGSNNTLVAPVEIGAGAYTAAGSTITDSVEADALAIGRARQVQKEGWAEKWRNRS